MTTPFPAQLRPLQVGLSHPAVCTIGPYKFSERERFQPRLSPGLTAPQPGLGMRRALKVEKCPEANPKNYENIPTLLKFLLLKL